MGNGRIQNVAVGLLVVTLLLVVSFPFGCKKAEVPPIPAVQPIKVSVGMDQTGVSAGTALHVFRGVYHYYKWVNEHGGVEGAPLDVLWADTKYLVDEQLNFYRKVRDEGSVIHSIASTMEGVALKNIAGDDKMAILSGAQFCDPNIPLFAPGTLFAPNSLAPFHTVALLKWYLDNWKESRNPRVVFMVWDHFGGRAIFAGIPWAKENLKRGDGLQYEWLDPPVYVPVRSLDFSPYLMKVKEKKPDLVIVHWDAVDTGSCARDSYRMGLTKEMTFAGGSQIPTGSDAIKTAGKEALEGWLWPRAMESIYANQPGCEVARKMQEKYLGSVYDEANYMMGVVYGYISVEAIRKAIAETGTTNIGREAVLNAMFSLKDASTGGITPPQSFSKEKIYGYGSTMITIVKDGKQVPVSGWIEEPPPGSIPGCR